MASTYTTQLRLELQETGANSTTWGTKANAVFSMADDAIAGMTTVSTTGGTYTLTTANSAADESRRAILKITGVLVSTSSIVVPALTKKYTVWNATTGNYTCTVKTSAGTGVLIPQGGTMGIICDATNVQYDQTAVSDASFTICDDSDPTKKMAFQVSGITTGTTRTFAVPDANDTMVTLAATQTLSNKRITKRVSTITSSATPTPNSDTDDEYTVTAQAAGATFGAPTGTPTEGQPLIIRVKDNGTARALAFNAIYRASSDLALPTTTVISKTIYLGFVYNNTDTKWDLLAYLGNF